MELQYTVINPTKNITLLVTTPVEPALRPQLSARLMQQEKDACRVAFLERMEGTPRLAMAGGEFDAGAAMGLASLMAFENGLNIGDSWDLPVEVSGADAPVACTVTPVWSCDMVTVSMPLPERVTDVTFPLTGGSVTFPVVTFPGISHIIVPAGTVDRTAVREVLPYWANLLPTPAVGLLIWNEGASFFDPLLYVKATDTTAWTQSSADGSAAIAAWLTEQRQVDQCLSLKQPGGTIAAATRWQDGLTSLTVSGTVVLQKDKSANIVF